MKQRIVKIVAVIAAFFTTVMDLSAETPMEFFKDFRNNMENNDFTSSAIKFENPEKSRIIDSGKIPREMRRNALAVEAAYEDLYIRRKNPDTAVIYAFLDLDGQKKSLQIKLKSVGNSWVFAEYPFREGSMRPAEVARRFMELCQTGDPSGVEEYVSAEVDDSLPVFPDGLLAKIDFSTHCRNDRISPAKVAVERMGITGYLTLEKNGYFWKITAIDDILKQPFPDKIIPQITARCKAYNAQYPQEAAPAENNDTENAPEAEAPAADENSFSELAEYLMPGLKPSAVDVIRLAAVTSFENSAANGKIIFSSKINTSAEAGILKIAFSHNGSKWLISEIDSDLVYKKSDAPENAIHEFMAFLIKKDVDKLQTLSTGLIKAALASQQIPADVSDGLTYTVDKTEITGDNSAELQLSWKNSDSQKQGTATVGFTLTKSKWLISSLQFQQSQPESTEADTAE